MPIMVENAAHSKTLHAQAVDSATCSAQFHGNPSTSKVPSNHSNVLVQPLVDASSSFMLREKLVGDVSVAVTVTALAAPFLTIIDKALVERSAGTHSVLSSVSKSVGSMLRHPVAFVRSPTYLWMWGTYAATYSAANTLRTLTEYADTPTNEISSTSLHANRKENNTGTPPVSVTASTTLFLGTAVVNSTMSILKDSAYAKLYGSVASVSIPKITYGLWMLRDLTVIGAAFVLPSHVASVLQKNTNLNKADSTRVAQLATPVAVQVIAGPLHFVGYDCYNRSLSHLPSWRHIISERARFLQTGLVEVVVARMVRILPGYGMAGVWNTELRKAWRHQVATKDRQRFSLQWESSASNRLD